MWHSHCRVIPRHRGAGCVNRARPDLWEPGASNAPGPPDKLPDRLAVRRSHRRYFFAREGPGAPPELKSTTGDFYGLARSTAE